MSLGDDIQQLPPSVITSGWLGYPGATEMQLSRAETRLKCVLPPSYRDFLKVTNGWRHTTPFIYKLWPVEEIEWFAVRRQDWIDTFVQQQATERTQISDSEYWVYGDEQDCSKLRVKYLQQALEISDRGDASIYLLNPNIVTADGEWEAWFFGDWLPGADRYSSFKDLMQAEYETFLELRDIPSSPIFLMPQPFHQSAHEEIDHEGDRPIESTDDLGRIVFETNELETHEFGTDEANLERSPALGSSGWATSNRFLVTVQTRRYGNKIQQRTSANHWQTNTSQTFTDKPFDDLYDWIDHQLKQSVTTSPAEPETTREHRTPPISPRHSLASNSSSNNLIATIHISNVRVYQRSLIDGLPALPEIHLSLHPIRLKSAHPTTIELSLTVGEQPNLQAFSPIAYHIQYFAQDLVRDAALLLGDVEVTLIQTHRVYSVISPTIQLQRGLYRLQILATSNSINAKPAYMEIPLLHAI
ncbi:MAG: SMI1/KNR4 family protein [Elainellaceae cyanobacterium]